MASLVADMVHVVDIATARVTKNIIVGTRPRRFIVTPDGKPSIRLIDDKGQQIKEAGPAQPVEVAALPATGG